jgi:molybdate transport system ATP-binding protein
MAKSTSTAANPFAGKGASCACGRKKPLITLEGVTVRLRDRWLLADTDWIISQHEHWAIVGPNGSGKSTLARTLMGQVPVVQGRLQRHSPAAHPDRIGYVSFELHEHLMQREEQQAQACAFSGNLNEQTLAGDLIDTSPVVESARSVNLALIDEALDVRPLRKRPVAVLSEGEMRRLLIARSLMQAPHLLILDEPFAGIDHQARAQLSQGLARLLADGIQLILITHHFEEVLPGIEKLLVLEQGRVVKKLDRSAIASAQNWHNLFEPTPPIQSKNKLKEAAVDTDIADRQPLIRMRNTTIRYGRRVIIEKLNWTVRPGENWGLVGPNGSGKTSLLKMLYGDHLQAYANEIYLFGQRRGEGESIWELKAPIGFVSSELQRRFRRPLRVRHAVLSGFFDSVGLYQIANAAQREMAAAWIARLGISDLSETYFNLLSSGQRRLVMIARAMVKGPRLLVLDEPCQGLDQSNRQLVMGYIDQIGSQTDTQLIFVTHHHDEVPSCLTHQLALTADGRWTQTRLTNTQ